MAAILGIDLGTTNSAAAVIEAGAAKVIPLQNGKYTIPSVVAYAQGAYLVGDLAKRQALTNPANTFFVTKRLIGRSFDDLDTQSAIQQVSYTCTKGPQGDVRVTVGGIPEPIQAISARILGEIKKAAEHHLGEPVTQAVISVPAYFNDNQRQATRDAGRIAGLDVQQVINEPTAAALAFGFHQGAERKAAVYDLGGGTFDVSVLKVGGGVVEVLASAGDAFLGGHDFDNAIYEWLLGQVQATYQLDLRGNMEASQRLREAAEAAKPQ